MIRRRVRADGRFAAFAGRARHDRALVLTVFFAVLALAGCGAATESQAPPAVKTSSDIVALIDSPRLTSLSLSENVVTAEGKASRSEGDDLRTYWFTSIGAIAHVQHLGGSLIVRDVLVGTTLFDQYEGEQPVGTLTDPATFLSEADLNARTLRWAETAGVVMEELNYVPFLGGAAELVVRPKNELKFMRELDMTLYELFRTLPQEEERPFLLSIVDNSGANRRVWGFFSLGDGGSEGFAWQADDLSEALGWDASGRPIEGAQPVEGAPGP